ncbi:MAG TPA: class I SAM-dependent methyltransferase [Verrucomicrobia bacterium]|nr:class I SAM-dependent methyltransferase [Verrucomicrobiota bacterium]HOP97895.1 class I SAM-dependent methyltransferase [Verrucomicrobiota bacterium]HPU55788.1 class I SAM-dependent methyltransferase [Verrucomicrobiota bacterium]
MGSFDALAPHYRWMEFVVAGEKLQRCRTRFLGEIPAPRNVLLAGEGHGRSAVECRRRFPSARFTCLDASAPMLEQIRRRLERWKLGTDRVRFVHSDVLDWKPDGEAYDLIITNFFLDCFNPGQLERAVSRLSAAATEDANWLVSDFQIPCGGWKRIRARLIERVMYAYFRAVVRLPAERLVDPGQYLERAHFTLQRRAESEWGLLYSDWWARRGVADASDAPGRSCS